jgi:hypothetical protein
MLTGFFILLSPSNESAVFSIITLFHKKGGKNGGKKRKVFMDWRCKGREFQYIFARLTGLQALLIFWR